VSGSTSPVLVALWDGIGPLSPELATWLEIPVARDLRRQCCAVSQALRVSNKQSVNGARGTCLSAHFGKCIQAQAQTPSPRRHFITPIWMCKVYFISYLHLAALLA
jgi:hypothetical protein